MKGKAKLISSILVLVLVLGISACTQVQQPDVTKPADESSKDKDVDPGTQTDVSGLGGLSGKLVHLSMLNEGEPTQIWVANTISLFEELTNVDVEVTYAGRDNITKLRSFMAAGNPPDLVDQSFDELSGALLAGDSIMAEPIDDLLKSPGLEGEKELADVFAEGLLDLYAKDGSIYLFPYQIVTTGFFYDENLFNKYGLTAPKTWDEFIDINRKLKENGIAPLALDGNISSYNAYYYYWAVQRIMGDGAFSAAAADKTGALWDEPGYLEAAKLVYQLSVAGENYFQEGYEGYNYPMAQNTVWALGEAGSVLCGSWLPKEIREVKSSEWIQGYYPFPTVEGGKGKLNDVDVMLFGWTIPKGAKNIENAKAFLKFAVRKERAELFAQIGMGISARKEAASHPLVESVKASLDNAASFHKVYDGVQANYPEWFSTIFYEMNNDLIFGKITPEEFISGIKEKTIAFWKTR
jgi:ABC-type glycerol-3-phosphate transport system substrate-binding protein